MRKYWLAAVCTGLCVTVPTVASANTAVGCWGIDRSGKRFVETSVKDFGELDYNGLMLVLNGWKKHANALGYDYAECNVFDTREKTMVSLQQRRNWNLDHSQSRSAWMNEFAAPAPPRKPDRISIAGPGSRSTTGPASIESKRKIAAASSAAPAAPKYVEVAGPDGPIRLSPEVAARNQAAADEYRRKMDDFARATAEHERTLALHQQSIAAAAAEKQEYQRKIAQNAAQVASNETAYLEQRKATAKPLGVNAVYRGFTGRTCEQARSSAIRGSGTDKGSQFVEVTQDLSAMPRLCIVQGWSWTTSKTGSSRQ